MTALASGRERRAATPGREDPAVTSGRKRRDATPGRPDPAGAVRPLFLDRPFASLHLLLVTTGLLTAIGILMVLSASSVASYDQTGSVWSLFLKQMTWLLIGIPAFWLGLRLTPKAYRRLAFPALAIALLGLLAVLVPGLGVLNFGARRWIAIGPLQLQPSEPAKLALALWGADLLIRKRRFITDWRYLFFPLLPVGVLMCGLVMLEPDLGTTLCFVLVLGGLLWTVGVPAKLFAALGGTLIGAIVVLIAAEPYRAQRLTAFLHPYSDPTNSGFQAAQGINALSTGGWWGVGLGQSRTKWDLLPNAHTDYIFAIIGEELGLFGCLVVLGLFAALAYAGVRVARRTVDPFVRLLAGAVTVWITGQALINMGYVTGLLPVTGIPLPLISAGGTSLVLTLFVLGMMCSFARHEPDAVAAVDRAGLGRVARLLRLPVPSLEPSRSRPRRARRRSQRRQAARARRRAGASAPVARRSSPHSRAESRGGGPGASAAAGSQRRHAPVARRSEPRAAESRPAQARPARRGGSALPPTGTDGRHR